MEVAVPIFNKESEVTRVFAAAGAIEMLSDRVTVALVASSTCTVNEEVPDAVGVPENTPEADSDTPAGSVPDSLHVYGVTPPDAARVAP